MRFIITIMAVALADEHCKDADGNSLVPEKCGDGKVGLVVDCADFIACATATKAHWWSPSGVAAEGVPTKCQGWLDLEYETCVPSTTVQVDPDCAAKCYEEAEFTTEDATITEAQACTDAAKFWKTCAMKDECTPTANAIAECADFMTDATTWTCDDPDSADSPVPTGTVGECNVGDAHECYSFLNCVEPEAAATCDTFAGDCPEGKGARAGSDTEGDDADACCSAPDCDAVPKTCTDCKAMFVATQLAKKCTDAQAAKVDKDAVAPTADEIAEALKTSACGLAVGEGDAPNADATCTKCLDSMVAAQVATAECKYQEAAYRAGFECKDETKAPTVVVADVVECTKDCCDYMAAGKRGCESYMVCVDETETGGDASVEEEAPTNTKVDADTQTAIEEALGDDFPKGLFKDDGTWDTKVLKTLNDAQLDKICDSDKVDAAVCAEAKANHKYEAPDNTSAAFIAGIGAMSFLALLL